MIGTLLEKLFVSVGVDLSGFGSELDRATQEVDSTANDMKRSFADVGETFMKVGSRMSIAGQGLSDTLSKPLLDFAVASSEAATESGKAMAQVQSALASMGPVAGKTADDLSKLAANLQATSTFDDDDILSKVTANLLTFGNVSGDVFDRAQQAAVNLSARLGQDLQSSAIQLGKALNDPVNGVTALQRVGVSFTESQKEQIKAMVAAGNAAGAQKMILGELEKQFGGAAQAQRDATPGADTIDAWRNFQETVGGAVNEVLPILTEMLTSVLNAFNSLSPEMQKVVIGAAALVAVLGPVMTVVGGMVTAFGALLPIIGAAIPIISGFAGFVGGLFTVLMSLTGAVPILAAIAAAGYLIYENWDKISPVLSEFWSKVQEVLGPKLMALVETVKSGLTSLWQGPFGDALRMVITILGEFGAAYTSVMGEALIRIISAAVDLISGAFTTIVNVIKLVVAVLTGDWAGAWEATKALVSGVVTTILNVINSLAPGATAAMKALYEGVKTWIWDRLNAIWDGVKAKIETVKGWFFGLYDAVVGHSYIPDMVDEIGQNMARLQSLMVDPAKAATTSTKEAFRGLASDVSGVLDRLFPLQAQLRSVLADMATLDKAKAAGQIDATTYDAARGKLDTERRDIDRELNPIVIATESLAPLNVALLDLSAIIGELPRIATDAELALQDFGERLGDGIMGALRDVLSGRGSLKDVARDMLSRFFERTITDALKSLETSIFGEGGLGGFLGGLFSSVISGRAVGGPVVPGRAYTVGAGEKFVPSQTGRVLSRSDAMAAVGGTSGGIGRIAVTVNGARGNQEIMEMVREGVQQGLGQYDRVVGDRVDTSFKRRG